MSIVPVEELTRDSTSNDDLTNMLIEEEQANKDSKLTHIITSAENLHIWEEGMTSGEVVSIARMMGYELTALCGFKWVPKSNPEKFDICQTCVDIARFRMQMAGE